MKKRNIIIATVIAGVVGSGMVVAGGKHYRDNGHHGGYMIKRMVHHLDDHVDLSRDQKSSIREIMESSYGEGIPGKKQLFGMRGRLLQLDPAAEDYDSQLASLADDVARLAHSQVLTHGDVYRQVALVLTVEQRAELKEHMKKRMDRKRHHDHDGGDES